MTLKPTPFIKWSTPVRLSKRSLLAGSALVIMASASNKTLSSRQQALVLGNILGDGHLQLSPNGKTSRLRFYHSMAQAEYVKWQFKEFDWLCEGVSPPKEIIFSKKVVIQGVYETKTYRTCRAYTSYRAELTPYHTLTYKPSKMAHRRFQKTIPSNFSEYLKDPESLMVWYLDDGTLRLDGGACRLATQSFTLDEHAILQDCLWQNFHIKSVIERWSGNYCSLTIPARGGYARQFTDLFAETVKKEIPSMVYKIHNSHTLYKTL